MDNMIKSFTILPQNSQCDKYCNVSIGYFCNLLDQLLHPYKADIRSMSGILFVICTSCEPLTQPHSLALLKTIIRHNSTTVQYFYMLTQPYRPIRVFFGITKKAEPTTYLDFFSSAANYFFEFC